MKVTSEKGLIIIIVLLMILVCILYYDMPVVLLIFGFLFGRMLVAVGRTFYFHPNGCTVTFLCYRKEYTWNEFKIKQYVDCSRAFATYRGSVYKSCAEFSSNGVRRFSKLKAETYCEWFHPFSFIYVYFLPEEYKRKELKWTYVPGIYTVDESEFKGKMKEWGVDIVENQ